MIVAPPLLAHGLGDASDLPLPLPLLLYASAGAVLGLSLLLSRRPQPRPAPRASVLPAGWSAVLDARVTRVLLRMLGALLLLAAAVPAALGLPDGAVNPAPRVLFAVVWGWLLFASLAFGPVWRRLNPLRSLSALLARLAGDPDETLVRPLPKNLGYWPAAVSLAVFLILEAAAAEQPLAVLVFLSAHTLVHVGAATVYGSRWFARADPFEVTSELVGRCALLGRRSDGRLEVGSPRERLADLPVEPGLVAVLALLAAGNLFDGVTATTWWGALRFGLTGAADAAAHAAGLGVVALVTFAAFRVATVTRSLAPALVGVVVGYAVAHYFAVVLIESQTALAQLSDPFARGWDLLGTADWYASYELLPGTAAAVVRLIGFLAGHLGAIVVADVIARRGRSPRHARAVQVPLRAVVAVSVLVGTWLLFGG